MKLDIEALAREAGFKQRHNSPVEWWMLTPDIETFTCLIVERCAAECDYVYHQNIGPGHGEVRYGVASCAAAIRQLLEDK